MNLIKILSVLWRRKWILLTTASVLIAVITLGTLRLPRVYQASTVLRVKTYPDNGTSADFMYSDRLTNTYASIITSRPLLDKLKEKLGVSELPQIDVKVLPNTELVQILVKDSDPVFASKTAGMLGKLFIEQNPDFVNPGGKSATELLGQQVQQISAEISQARANYDLQVQQKATAEKLTALAQSIDLKQKIYADLLTQYEQTRMREALRNNTLSIIEPAYVPSAPIQPNVPLYIALGVLLGLLAGVVLAFIVDESDTTLYSSSGIESAAKIPLLTKIPRIPRNNLDLSRVPKNKASVAREAFITLSNSLLTKRETSSKQVFLVTSSQPGEGKSTVVANLARIMGPMGKRVVVVDGDMRNPIQHKFFYVNNKIGLSNVLVGANRLHEAVYQTKDSHIYILPSGPLPYNPVELIRTHTMIEIINTLKETFDVVLIDAPAVFPLADALILSTMCDEVLMVFGRGVVKEENILAAVKLVDGDTTHPVEMIINQAEGNWEYRYRHSGIPLLRTDNG